MDQLISNHSLFIDKNFEDFINNFCSTTGQNFPQGKLGNYLGSWYEGYIYCLLIGLNTNHRHYGGYENKHQKVAIWSNQNINQYKYCLARVISRDDVISELGLDTRVAIIGNFSSIENCLGKLKEICDQFALGGVRYLKGLYDNDNRIFDEPYALFKIYENTLEIE
jgi:hypothetical protein